MELDRRYHRKEKMRKLKRKLIEARGEARDKVLAKIHARPDWTEPKRLIFFKSCQNPGTSSRRSGVLDITPALKPIKPDSSPCGDRCTFPRPLRVTAAA